jgi:phosphohistidine swiveling domain-containing protein
MESLELIVWADDSVSLGPETIKGIGGKAFGLHELKKIGVRVPLWATITSGMFKGVCQKDSQLNNLFKLENIDPSEKAGKIREYLQGSQLEGANREILRGVWNKISNGGKRSVAVRSSAADEDSKVLSFAGQMDSFLNILSFEAFVRAIRGCWSSLFGERAVLYRIQHGIDPWDARIAVVVQQMIESEIAGVVFTANPLTGNTNEMLVSSTWGLGEGLVSGMLDADTFTLDARGAVIKSEIAEKKQRINYLQGGATASVEVELTKQSVPSLAKKQLKELHAMAQKVQNFKKIPMDIEFGVEGGRIYLLQARPITNLKKYAEFNVWDNSNIVESYLGVTTPLTFSFIRRAYFAVYWQFCQTIGLDKKTILTNTHVFENMLGLIQGRVYYNLLNWYRLVSLMPGFKYNKRFMEQMMGLQVIKDIAVTRAPSGKFEKYFIQLPRLLKVSAQMILAHMQLQRKINEFHVNFRKVYFHYSQLDYARLTLAEMLAVYRTLEKEVLWKWKAPITNDFEAMIFYGLLKNLTIKWELDPQGVLQNDLLCGEGGIKSTQVTTQLFYLAREIERDIRLKTAFLEVSPEEALARLRSDKLFAAAKVMFEQYLKEYGVRCINEMKLESVPIKDNPVFCISIIQNYLRNTVPDPAKQEEHERSIRLKAEDELREKLKDQKAFLVVPKFNIYRWVLNNARRAIKNRENQRFCRTEAYSLIRTIMRAIGSRWENQGILDNAEDIFYLEMDEIWSFIEGKPLYADLKKQIRKRHEEFERHKTVTLPDHIEAYGEVDISAIQAEEAVVSSCGVMKGLGCCAGIVEKEVRVVFTPDVHLRLNGEIMVAKQTDPGWVVLFPLIGGLIVEKGSMLSHSAIVAREMGIPAVVGVKNATKLLSSGDRVLLNGAEGTIRILEKANT